jgi:flagellar hook protein FlgE
MSFFTSLSGLRNAETDLRVIAHNIANAETVGFKKSSAQFADLVASGAPTDPRRTAGISRSVRSNRPAAALISRLTATGSSRSKTRSRAT